MRAGQRSKKRLTRRRRRRGFDHTGLSRGFVKAVGKKGFTEVYNAMVAKGTPPEIAKRIAGKGKGLARKHGWLAKKHEYPYKK